MVPKHKLILVLALLLTLSTSSSYAAKLPAIEIANHYSKTIRIKCKELSTVDLSPGQKFSFGARLIDGRPMHCFCTCDYIYADVIPYDPDRDTVPNKIYWKAEKGGFYLSYDKIHWKFGAPWDTE